MLRLAGEQVESLFDEALPVEVRQLPEELKRIDRLLEDAELLRPIEAAWPNKIAATAAPRSRWRATSA